MSDAIFSVQKAFLFTWPNGSTIRLNGKPWKKIGLFRLLGPLDTWDRCSIGARVRWVNPLARLKYLKRYPSKSGITLNAAEMACVMAESDLWFGGWHSQTDQDTWDHVRSEYLDRLLSECQFEEYLERRPIRAFLKRCWVEANDTDFVRSLRRAVAAWFRRNRPAPLDDADTPKKVHSKSGHPCGE